MTGQLDDKYAEIAALLKDTPLDPNYHWQRSVIPLINDKFVEIRDEFVTALSSKLEDAATAFNTILPSDQQIAVSTLRLDAKPEVQPTPIDGSFADAAPYLDEGTLPPAATPIRARGTGEPLPMPLRASVEERFGHDFSHVRIHRGWDGADAVRSVRALALTSGSHIYVDPSLALDTPRGRHVLDHELTHVLQQAGPRPKGALHSSVPRRRDGRRGLIVDPQAEEEADAVAKYVATRRGHAPVRVGVAANDGYAPAFDAEVAFGFLRLLTDFRASVQFQERIDLAVKEGKKADARIKGLPIAAEIWKDVKKALDKEETFVSGGLLLKRTTFVSVRSEIREHVLAFDKAVTAAVPLIAEDAVRRDADEERKVAEKTGAKKKPVRWMVNPRTFADMLSGYIFTKSGVALDLKVKDKLDAPKPLLTEAHVTYLNLGAVGLGKPLWTKLGGRKDLSNDDLRELAVRLATLDPVADLWDTKKYALAGDWLEKYLRRKKRRPTAKPPPKAGPYSKGLEADTLRVGKHGDLAGTSTTLRESHHTTQYLLIEYFRNDKKTAGVKIQPFSAKLPGAAGTDGVEWVGKAGGAAESFKAPGKKRIQIGALYAGDRGDPMPAILLARETHREGRLHIDRMQRYNPGPEGGKTDGKGSVTQGFAVDSHYRALLGNKQLLGALDDAKVPALIASKGEGKVLEGVHDAMIGTYRWIWDLMRKALDEALPRNEVAFFSGLAARHQEALADATTGKLKPEYQLGPTLLGTTFSNAVKKNNEVMNPLGWA